MRRTGGLILLLLLELRLPSGKEGKERRLGWAGESPYSGNQYDQIDVRALARRACPHA